MREEASAAAPSLPAWLRRVDVLSLVLGVIALLVSTAITLYSREVTELTISSGYKYQVFTPGQSSGSQLQLLYNQQAASNVTSLDFTLQNSGNKPITPQDYVRPLAFAFEPPAEIAAVELVDRRPQTVDLQVTQIQSNTFALSDSLLNPGDSVRVRVTFVNDPYPDEYRTRIVELGRIAGMSQAQVRTPDDGGVLNWFVFVSVPELLMSAIAASLLLFLTLFVVRRRQPAYLESRWAELRIVAIAFMSALTVVWLLRVTNVIRNGRDDMWYGAWIWPTVGVGMAIALYYLYVAVVLRRHH